MAGPAAADLDALTFRPVEALTRADFVRFFESAGAPKHCWCMVRRRSPAEAKEKDAAGRRRQMMHRLDAGVPLGLLACDGSEPVGWVSVAPRETYRNLGGPPAGEGEAVWSIVCFYVPRRLRGQGMTRRLIEAAVSHARQAGATVVEAYPVDVDAPSYRFMGFVPTFAAAGFADAGMAGTRRHVMRLRLGRSFA